MIPTPNTDLRLTVFGMDSSASSSFFHSHELLIQLRSFLDASSVGKLDNALTNKTLRPIWLGSLQTINTYNNFDEFEHSKGSLRWILNRLVPVSRLLLTYDNDVYSILRMSLDFPRVKEIVLRDFKWINERNIAVLCRASGDHLTSLDLRGCGFVDDASLDCLGRLCPRLSTLNLSCCVVNGSGLALLARHCTELKHLGLERGYNGGGTVRNTWNEGLTALNRHCLRLESIDVSLESEFTDENARCLFGAGAGAGAGIGYRTMALQTINFFACSVSDFVLERLAMTCPNLRSLCMRSSREYTSSGLRHIAFRCSRLEVIDLRCCFFDAVAGGMEDILRECTSLKEFYLGHEFRHVHDMAPILARLSASNIVLHLTKCVLRNVDLGEHGLVQLAKMCPDLEHLSVQECTDVSDSGMFALAAHCPRLKVLEMPLCEDVTAVGLRVLGRKCKRIESLDISGWYGCPDYRVRPVTEFTKLTSLSVLSMKNLSEATIIMLTQSLPNLESWSSTTDHITNSTIDYMVKGFPRLRNVQINSNGWTDVGLVKLLLGCRRLETIDLYGSTFCSDRSLALIAAFISTGVSHRIRRVGTRFCSAVTEGGVRYLLKNCPGSIREVDVSENRDIQSLAMERLRAEFPKVTFQWREMNYYRRR
jgi:Leucine Rich repeat